VKLLAILAGLAALGFGIYLAVLLGSIRKRAFGAGRRIEVPGAGIALTCPDWWTVEGAEEVPQGASGAGHTAIHSGGGGGAVTPPSNSSGFATVPVEPAEIVRIRTNHRRGLLTIERLEHGTGAPSTTVGDLDPLEIRLREILQERGIVLDELDFRSGRAGAGASGGAGAPREGSGGEARASGPSRQEPVQAAPPGVGRAVDGATGYPFVAVSSGGILASEPETRTYFELIVIDAGRGLALLTYTNSVLQGFLDAFYIEKLLQTVHTPTSPPAPGPGPTGDSDLNDGKAGTSSPTGRHDPRQPQGAGRSMKPQGI
jgi:hypothetical protein